MTRVHWRGEISATIKWGKSQLLERWIRLSCFPPVNTWPLPRLRSGLLTACYRSACLPVWLASFDFIQLPFRSIYTTSGSLLGEQRMTNSREKKTLVWKCYLKTFSCSRKQRHPLHIFESKTVRLRNRNWWIWFTIIQHAESTWIHLNSQTAHDRLIVSNSFWLFFFFTSVTFALCDLN